MKPPDRIWLQPLENWRSKMKRKKIIEKVKKDIRSLGRDFNMATWYKKKVHGNDVEYIRVDVVRQMIGDAMKDGIINLDTPAAKRWGFIPTNFDGYLWKTGDVITISFIESLHPGMGNFRRLLDAIENDGFEIQVPTPSSRMRQILHKRGYTEEMLHDEELGSFEVMRKARGSHE